MFEFLCKGQRAIAFLTNVATDNLAFGAPCVASRFKTRECRNQEALRLVPRRIGV